MSQPSGQGVLCQAADLSRLSQAILEAVGTPEDLASIVAGSLVDANLVGHDSHGVIRLTSYAGSVRNGQVQPAARATVEFLGDVCARVDAAWGWGQPAAHLAADTASVIARRRGVGLVTVGRCNHIGRLGEYIEKLSRAGQIGLMFCNSPPAVAPYGGYTRLLGTNPISWGAPRARGQHPIVMDFATASIAEGKLRIAQAVGSKAPLGSVVDKEGRPSTETAAFYDGGALTTFGAHKGFGLSVMIELMAGILSGTGSSSDPAYMNGNGTTVLAVDVNRFMTASDFTKQVDALEARLRSAPKAKGFDQILMPGDLESRSRAQRTADGISIPIGILRSINDLAEELGLSPI